MSKTKKKVVYAFLLCVFLVGGGGVYAVAAPPIKIGYVSSFTGLMGEDSTRNLHCWKMVMEEANKTGGLAGRRVELIVRDDKGVPADQARMARDLVYTEKVDLLAGSHSTPTSIAVGQVAKELKTLVIGYGMGSSPVIQRNRYFFRAVPHFTVQTRTMASFAHKKGWKKVALLNPDYSYGHMFSEDTGRWFTKEPGAEVKADLHPKFGCLDYAPYITKLMGIKDLDAILAGLWSGDVTTFLKQAVAYGLFDKIHLVIVLMMPTIEALGKEMPEGIYGVAHFYPWIPGEKVKKFVKAYYDYTGSDPGMEYNGYCSALAYAAAVRKAGTADTEAVINALEGITFDTPTGPMSIRPLDHQGTMRAVLGRTVYKPEYPKHAILEDFYMPDPAKFLPTKEEILKMKPF